MIHAILTGVGFGAGFVVGTVTTILTIVWVSWRFDPLRFDEID